MNCNTLLYMRGFMNKLWGLLFTELLVNCLLKVIWQNLGRSELYQPNAFENAQLRINHLIFAYTAGNSLNRNCKLLLLFMQHR